MGVKKWVLLLKASLKKLMLKKLCKVRYNMFGTEVAYQTRFNMPLELTPSPKLTYKLRLTPQMRLSLNLLQLPLIKLKEYIKQEIEKNPLLELIDREPNPPKGETQMTWLEECWRA